jgi:uncharacterized flavoprotein (TIGR03862 family)
VDISLNRSVAIVGSGPAGLMAAEIIARAGVAVTLFERMPGVGRKFLMAGRGGLNITHSEPFECFPARYGSAAAWAESLLAAFPPSAVIAWCEALGQPTFTGSSGRIFPQAMKASPLLRAWIRRLEGLGVRFVTRAQWTGWDNGALTFADGRTQAADAIVLALGGASWPRLGTDGSWTGLLGEVEITPLRPANCGFFVGWSQLFSDRHAGAPLKGIALSLGHLTVRGEIMITSKGVEGNAIYALAAPARETIAREGSAPLAVDLRPDVTVEVLAQRLAEPRGSASLSNFLRKRAGLSPAAIGLVQEALHADENLTHNCPHPVLAKLIKSLPLRLLAPFGLERAISTAGGIALSELNEHLMLRKRPGVFAAGEMLDWEAPTGGYLLHGALATGVAAGVGVLDWLRQKSFETPASK